MPTGTHLEKRSHSKAFGAKKPCFMRLSAQTKRAETSTKLPGLDKQVKWLEISLRVIPRGFESHSQRKKEPAIFTRKSPVPFGSLRPLPSTVFFSSFTQITIFGQMPNCPLISPKTRSFFEKFYINFLLILVDFFCYPCYNA